MCCPPLTPPVRFQITQVSVLPNSRSPASARSLAPSTFGNTDTWVIWNLTGGVNGGQHITDYTNASRTMLFNLAETDWDQAILDTLAIPRALLPERRPWRPGPRLRRCRRSAGGAVRAGLLRRRPGQEHLRHRQLPAAEHRPRRRALQVGAADDRVLRVGEGQELLRPGRLDRDHRCGGAVAPRQPQADRLG